MNFIIVLFLSICHFGESWKIWNLPLKQFNSINEKSIWKPIHPITLSTSTVISLSSSSSSDSNSRFDTVNSLQQSNDQNNNNFGNSYFHRKKSPSIPFQELLNKLNDESITDVAYQHEFSKTLSQSLHHPENLHLLFDNLIQRLPSLDMDILLDCMFHLAKIRHKIKLFSQIEEKFYEVIDVALDILHHRYSSSSSSGRSASLSSSYLLKFYHAISKATNYIEKYRNLFHDLLEDEVIAIEELNHDEVCNLVWLLGKYSLHLNILPSDKQSYIFKKFSSSTREISCVMLNKILYGFQRMSIRFSDLSSDCRNAIYEIFNLQSNDINTNRLSLFLYSMSHMNVKFNELQGIQYHLERIMSSYQIQAENTTDTTQIIHSLALMDCDVKRLSSSTVESITNMIHVQALYWYNTTTSLSSPSVTPTQSYYKSKYLSADIGKSIYSLSKLRWDWNDLPQLLKESVILGIVSLNNLIPIFTTNKAITISDYQSFGHAIATSFYALKNFHIGSSYILPQRFQEYLLKLLDIAIKNCDIYSLGSITCSLPNFHKMLTTIQRQYIIYQIIDRCEVLLQQLQGQEGVGESRPSLTNEKSITLYRSISHIIYGLGCLDITWEKYLIISPKTKIIEVITTLIENIHHIDLITFSNMLNSMYEFNLFQFQPAIMKNIVKIYLLLIKNSPPHMAIDPKGVTLGWRYIIFMLKKQPTVIKSILQVMTPKFPEVIQGVNTRGLVMWWESLQVIPNTVEMYPLYELILKQTMEQVQNQGIDCIASVLLLRYITSPPKLHPNMALSGHCSQLIHFLWKDIDKNLDSSMLEFRDISYLLASFHLHHHHMKDIQWNTHILQRLFNVLDKKLNQSASKQDLHDILGELSRISKLTQYLNIENIRGRMIDFFNRCLQLYKPYQGEDLYYDRDIYMEFKVELFQNLILQSKSFSSSWDGEEVDYRSYPAIFDAMNIEEQPEKKTFIDDILQVEENGESAISPLWTSTAAVKTIRQWDEENIQSSEAEEDIRDELDYGDETVPIDDDMEFTEFKFEDQFN